MTLEPTLRQGQMNGKAVTKSFKYNNFVNAISRKVE